MGSSCQLLCKMIVQYFAVLTILWGDEGAFFKTFLSKGRLGTTRSTSEMSWKDIQDPK